MTPTQSGMAIAAVLGVVWVTVGFWAAVLVAVVIVIGALVGRIVEGKLDVRVLADAVTGKRSSS